MKEHSRYIFSSGELLRKDFSILFKNEKGNNYLPIKDTRELYCFNDVTLSTKFLDLIAKAGITIHFFNYYGNYTGTFYPKDYLISGELTIKQALAFSSKRTTIAKAIIKGIADNIHDLLYHYYRHGKTDLKVYLDWLKTDVPKLLSLTDNIKQLLVIEGQIWARFYATFKFFLPEDFILNKRVRRPPDNPINALISFGNSILYTKTVTQIYHTHLNQSISYLHEPGEGRFSLSLDLSEAFKPGIVFRTIFDCVNNRKIQVSKHFESKLNYCLLNDTGKKVFIEAFEDRINQVFDHVLLKRKTTYKNAIKLDGYKLIKFILEDKPFKPFRLGESQ
jgi:CRISPR-associated protein Cas1